MYILAIETTGPLCSVALLKNKEILGTKTGTQQRNHLKDLMPLIRDLLAECKVDKKSLDYIAASVGPGSFTGVRIGVTTARALGQALGIKVISVPTLDAYCYKPEAKESELVTCGIINARRGQVYGIIEEYMPGGPYMLVDVLEVLKNEVFTAKKKVQFFGDGIDAYHEQIEKNLREAGYTLGKDYFYSDEEFRHQDAVSVGLLAWEKAEKGELHEVQELLPDYMRKAEAQQKLEAGQLPICKGPKQE